MGLGPFPVGAILLLVSVAIARPARSQDAAPRVLPELRADAIVAHATAAQLGAGAFYALTGNFWLGADLAGGIVVGDDRRGRASARADVEGRIHFDTGLSPRWMPYLLGGISERVGGRARGMLYALAGIGVQGPTTHRVVPAVELGLGGGVRVGVVLQPGTSRGRGG